jgi:hypothetical protein
MKIRVTYIATIDNQELIDNGISLTDKDAIIDYFYEMGGEETFHDFGEEIEIIG